MASKQVVHPAGHRAAHIKCIIGVICLLSIGTLLVKSVVYRNVLTTPERGTGPSIKSFTSSNGTEYEFPCELSEPRALDAIKRAITDECKFKLANAACKNAHGKLTPREIVSQCPSGGYVPFRLVGCFPLKEISHNTVIRTMQNNTPKTCVYFCKQRDFRYAMLQNGKACYCGDDRPNPNERLNDRRCNLPCSGNPAHVCGGSFESSVYETGLAKHPEQPIRLHSSSKEKPVRIAFLLMFHKRNLRQIRRLLRVIYDRNHYYFIHVDPKQHYLFRELLKLEKDFPNIHVSRQRHTITWACFTQLQALLASLKHMLSIPTWNPDYILNLSESDFPVMTITKLTQFLTANRGRNFLLMQGMVTVDEFISKAGYDKQFVECENRMWLIGDRDPPNGIVTNGASDWFCLTRDFVQYALDMREDLVVDILAVMKHTAHSTENFFSQLLQNSRFCQTHYNSNLRVISWVPGKGCPTSRSVEWTGCSPITIRREDFPLLQERLRDDIYAVRKINPIFDQTIILILEEKVFGKYPTGVPNLNSYWQSVYHHADETHEDRMNAVLNVAHVLLYINAQANKLEQYEVLKILEITHYFNRNAFEGFLIRHVALFNDHRLELEVFVKPKNKFKPHRTLVDQIANFKLEMSNTIDVVENEPIDFDRVLTVDKQPVVVLRLPKYKTLANTITHTVSVELINPRQQSVAMEKHTIVQEPEEDDHHLLHSTVLKTPLVPGIWCAKVSVNESYVGMIHFLTVKQKPILPRRFSSSTDSCVRQDGFPFENTTCKLGNVSFMLRQQFRFIQHVAQMYQIESTCIVSGEIASKHFNVKPFDRCTSSLWSSFAPDPKSDVHYRLKKGI